MYEQSCEMFTIFANFYLIFFHYGKLWRKFDIKKHFILRTKSTNIDIQPVRSVLSGK